MKRFYDESMRYIILYKTSEKIHDVLGCSGLKEMAEYICKTHNDPRCYYMENTQQAVIGTPNIDHLYENAFAEQKRLAESSGRNGTADIEPDAEPTQNGYGYDPLVDYDCGGV